MAAAGIAAGTALATASVAGSEEPRNCWPAAAAMTAILPELVSKEQDHIWRNLPVTIACTKDGEVSGFSVEWRASAPGLLLDARSAIASLGARLTGDTASSINTALERCITQAQRTGETTESEVARFALKCRVTQETATLAVRRRVNR